MPPQSRGPPPPGLQSKSTPNLPIPQHRQPQLSLSSIPSSPPELPTSPSPSEPASIDDYSLDTTSLLLPSLSPPSSDGEEDDDEEEDEHVPNLPPRPIYNHQHSRSHTYLAPSAFAPPFYNRPPTPLPPSPSLTSLLRPLTNQNSRPTTPDPSSDEGATHRRGDITGTHTPNSAAASTLTSTFRAAKPIPRASPKVPTYEYYGFTLYLTSGLAFIVYLFWAFLPSPFLHQLGIYYYPNRWWALAIPAWMVMLVVYIYVALASYNTGYLTLPLNSVESLVDEAANVAVVDWTGKVIRNEKSSWEGGRGQGGLGTKAGAKGKLGPHSRQSSMTKIQPAPELDWRNLWTEGTDAVMDIPIGGVCEILYGAHDDDGSLYDE